MIIFVDSITSIVDCGIAIVCFILYLIDRKKK